MRPFAYKRADDATSLVQIFSAENEAAGAPASAEARFIAGGTTFLDLMKLDVMRPSALIDINGVRGWDRVDETPDGLRLGALARMADVARHPLVKGEYPVIAQSLALAASAQHGDARRQRASAHPVRLFPRRLMGRLQQAQSGLGLRGDRRRQSRPRGARREPLLHRGLSGRFRPGADRARRHRRNLRGGERRTFPFAELHRPPGDRPDLETTLAPDELILAFRVAAGDWTRRSRFLKVRDRESYEFALASAAVALDMDSGGPVRQARIALGGVATIPWRARAAEALLAGRPVTTETAERAAEAAFKGAEPQKDNAFKIALGRKTLARALIETAAMELPR
jgi:xanthine dehydrogenase YagS FAD-binding subunit